MGTVQTANYTKDMVSYNDRKRYWNQLINTNTDDYDKINIGSSTNSDKEKLHLTVYVTFNSIVKELVDDYINHHSIKKNGADALFNSLTVSDGEKEVSYLEYFKLKKDFSEKSVDGLIAHLAINLTDGPLATDKKLTLKVNGTPVKPVPQNDLENEKEIIKPAKKVEIQMDPDGKPIHPGFGTWLKSVFARMFFMKNSPSVKLMDEYYKKNKDYTDMIRQEREKAADEEARRIKENMHSEWIDNYRKASELAEGYKKYGGISSEIETYKDYMAFLKKNAGNSGVKNADRKIQELEEICSTSDKIRRQKRIEAEELEKIKITNQEALIEKNNINKKSINNKKHNKKLTNSRIIKSEESFVRTNSVV